MAPRRDTRTPDLFDWQPPELVERFDADITRAASQRAAISKVVSAALRDCELDRDAIAERMGEYLGEDVSKPILDAYASEARKDHSISVPRYLALIHATGDRRLLQFLADQFGLAVIDRKYLKMIQALQAREEADRLNKMADRLRAEAGR